MDKFISTIVGLFLAFLLLAPVIFVFTVIGGYAVQLYWVWFMIPIFPMLVPLTLAKAVGLSMFVNIFTFNLSRYDHEISEKTDKVEKLKAYVYKYISTYLVIFLLGYVVHLFI